jgi:HK97 family phage major capsid protein
MQRPGSVQLGSPARDFVRNTIASAVKTYPDEALAYARQRWGSSWVERSAVAGTEADGLEVSASSRAAFFRLVTERSVIGRLPGLRRVSPNIRTLRPNNFTTAHWVGESKSVPASHFDLQGYTIGSKKAASLAIFSNESLQDPNAENAIEADLVRACVAALDGALLDPSNSGSAAEPAAATYNAATVASSGDPAADIADLVANFGGDLSNAVFVTDPTTAARLALYRDTSGTVLFPDAGITGGEILRAPLLVTRYSPHDTSGGSIALIDGASIAASLEDVSLSRTTEALLEADTAPQGASDTPVAASATLISLFQNELMAIKAVVYADWKVVRSNGVGVITGANY